MEKRLMKKLGIEMPLLGMGLMRLPMKDGKIDEQQSIDMVDTMYNAGVRYFDTAYVYIEGESERFAKRALVERYERSEFCLATKLPMFKVNAEADCRTLFDEQLERTGAGYFDFYLLHALNGDSWEKAKKFRAHEFQHEMKKQGLIRYAGFSFHGSPDELRTIVAEGEWDFAQLQINYYDWYDNTARELYEILRDNGIPCIVMEPVRGGGLVRLGDGEDVLRAANPDLTPAGWAMRWIGSRPDVNVVLSGVSTIEMAQENINYYAPLVPFTDEEEETVKKVVEVINSRPFVPCTGCRYCMDCPNGVNIPVCFEAVNSITKYLDKGEAHWHYFGRLKDAERADSCIGCGVCVSQCPQRIDIPAELARARQILDEALS